MSSSTSWTTRPWPRAPSRACSSTASRIRSAATCRRMTTVARLATFPASSAASAPRWACATSRIPPTSAACSSFSDTCVLVVVAPLEDSPAEAAGLQAGDIVLAIDGESVEGLLAGGCGGARPRRGGHRGDAPDLRRDERAVRAEHHPRQDPRCARSAAGCWTDGIGYLALHGFSEASVDQFREAHPAAARRREPPRSSSTCATTRVATSTRPTRSPPSSSATA